MTPTAAHQHRAAGSQNRQPASPAPQGGPAGNSPAVVSLQREIGIALDATQPLAARCSSLGKLHAVMASHQSHRPAVAVAMLPLFLSRWPQLVSCLWDISIPQLAAAAAPLLGMLGALVASSRAAAAAADAVTSTVTGRSTAAAQGSGSSSSSSAAAAPTAAFQGPPAPPASLLFDWLLPLLTGAVPLPTGAQAPPQLQALLCRTLAYALQQLPSCTATAAVTSPPPPHSQQDKPADTADTAQLSASQPSASSPAEPAASQSTSQQQAGAGPATNKAKLLTVPVPPVAAEQLRQHASSVVRAVQQLLEAVSTPPELLGPLLQLLLEVIRLAPTVITGNVLRDLLDLLLGWSLDPGLQAKDRQLISRVLVVLRPCWLEEPGLAADVSSKLLADLRNLLTTALPPTAAAQASGAVQAAAAGGGVAAADTTAARVGPAEQQQASPAGQTGTAAAEDTAARAESVAAEQQQQPQQTQADAAEQQQQLQKLLALLSCLVALLKGTMGTSGQLKLVTGTVEFMQLAHQRASALAAASAACEPCPDSSWSSAAATLAVSMLALWEAVGADRAAAGTGTPLAGSSGDSACRPEQNPDLATSSASVSDSSSSEANSAAGNGQAGSSMPVGAGRTSHLPSAAASSTEIEGAAVCDTALLAIMSQQAWALVLKSLELPLLSVDDAVGLLGSISGTLTRALTAVPGTTSSSSSGPVSPEVGSQVGCRNAPQQQEGRVGLADGAAPTATEQDSRQNQQGQQQGTSKLDKQSWPSHLLSLVPSELPMQLWAATSHCRCSPLSDLQAAAAAVYSVAVLLADHLSKHSRQGCQETPAQQPGSPFPANQLLQAVLREASGLCGSLAQGNRSSSGDNAAAPVELLGHTAATPATEGLAEASAAGSAAAAGRVAEQQGRQAGLAEQQDLAAGLTMHHQADTLVFDLVLLESWLSCAQPAVHEQQAGVGSNAAAPAVCEQHVTAAAAVGACAVAVSGQVAELLLSGMRQLLQQQQQQGGPAGDAVIAGGVLDQLVAVLQVLLPLVTLPTGLTDTAASTLAPTTLAAAAGEDAGVDEASMAGAQQPAALTRTVLSCLGLLLTTPTVAVHQQVAAVQLLCQLLMQSQGTAAASHGGSTAAPSAGHACLQEGLSVLVAAAGSSCADVRAAAVDAASCAARAALECLLQPQHESGAASNEVFVACVQLLASRCSDLDAAVAEAAEAAAAELMLPVYLLSVCCGNSHSSWDAAADGASVGSSTTSAAAAGMGSKWKRLAALQPQQRAFKPVQLAQLFDLAFHASPAMLQRYHQRPGAQQQQQPVQNRLAAQAAALARLAQALPMLPQPAAGSGGSSSRGGGSSSSFAVTLQFEDLSSAAVMGWLLTQEAARQCVSARMRTHLGNPTQSFAALDRILQALLQQLQTDESPAAQQRTWQRNLLQQAQAAIPQQPLQLPQPGPRQQSEPQQLLQAPGTSAAAAAPPLRRPMQQPVSAGGAPGSGAAAGPEASIAAALEEQRIESEAAVAGLLDFMYALEVNIQAATEGSMMRPGVSKSVMAFFAGNKKVCEDWFSRTREALLCLSAAAGAHQHVLFQGMSRLQELHAQLKALTTHSQAQQQLLLQQEQERDKACKQEGSSAATAAAAAAAAIAISGLGTPSGLQQQPQQPPQQGRQGRAHQQQQQSRTGGQVGDSSAEQRKLKARPGGAAAPDVEQSTAPAGMQGGAAAAASIVSTGVPLTEQLRLLQQQYQAALLQLAGPLMSTLVLVTDACIALHEPFAVLGLQQWAHQSFHAVWEAVSQVYALDLSAAERSDVALDNLEVYSQNEDKPDEAPDPGSKQQQSAAAAAAAPSMLLLSWLPAAAAQAAGRYEDALQGYGKFLSSEACSTGLGEALRPWVHEQLAACYAALADWQGLAALCSSQQQQKQGRQEVQTAQWVQHWYFAGAAGLQQLHSWGLLAPDAHQSVGLQAVEQHLFRHRGGGRTGRGQHSSRSSDSVLSGSSSLQHLVQLASQHINLPGTSLAGVDMLQAVAALQLCGPSTGGSSSSRVDAAGGSVQDPGPISPRGRAGRSRAQGRVTGAQQQAQQHLSVAEQQQQVLAKVLDAVQQQLQAAASNPVVVTGAFSCVLANRSSSVGCAAQGLCSGLQQLSLLQLLQGQLLEVLHQHQQHADMTHDEGGALESTTRLLQLLQHCPSPADGYSSSSSGGVGFERVVHSTGDSLWSGALRQDGQLSRSLLADVSSATALVQCMGPADCSGLNSTPRTSQARGIVLREALLAYGSHGCTTTMQRLLHSAAASSAGCAEDAAWLQLLGSKLQLQGAPAASAASSAVEAHWRLLQQPLLRLQAESPAHNSSMAADGSPGLNANSLAAVYLSLASTLQQAAEFEPTNQVLTACPGLQQVRWNDVHEACFHALQADLPCCQQVVQAIPSGTATQPLQQLPQQQYAALACSAAALSLLPQHPAPWLAYGDLLHKLASKTTQPGQATDGALGVDTASQEQPRATLLFGASVEAYCMQLAALANTGSLKSPQQTLGVLIKILQVILQHGEQLQQQLCQALAACPAAVWQVLTNQLLAQLQHGSTAVRGMVQQLLQGLAVVVPCAVLYPLVVDVRSAQEVGQETPPELRAIVSQLQQIQPRMLQDTVAMAEALEGLTVTRWEAWAGLLVELSLETNRKLLSLRADVSRPDQQHLPPGRRMEVFLSRYNTVMAPVISSLQQHIDAATATDASSPDEASFRQQMLPQLTALLEALKQPPEELLKLAAGEQSDSDSDEDAEDAPSTATTKQAAGGRSPNKVAASRAVQAVDSGGWPLLKELRQQLQQHLRRQQHLQLASVAPQLSRLRNTAIPLPADDLTADMLPALPLRSALQCYSDSEAGYSSKAPAASGQSSSNAGASVLLAASSQAAPAAGSAGSGSRGNWLCIAAFDKQVAVLPTKTRPKRLLMLASDGSIHAFLLKGRDDLRVDERLMQFMRASNALLAAAEDAAAPALTTAASASGAQPVAAAGPTPASTAAVASAAAASVAGWRAGRMVPLRVRPYSITPFGRRAGLVQWVRHTTSLYGLFRNWQQAAAERYQAVAAAKRDAAAAAATAAAAGSAAPPKQAAGSASTGSADKAAETGSSNTTSVPLPLLVAANRPTDAFYARLLPALQAAGLPVGSARSSWPASVLRSTFASLVREAPRALLARQLLSGAAEPGGWWAVQQCFTASAATGSMVGWLLGLGDRHMDNLLLDRDSCELVHIDFSVCFDKGASLAVPEVVPFRLTQSMQVALGPGGLSGSFSAAAARVLSTLRSSSDLLCGLLQLLLSDSGVDWSVDREAHAARKDQDTAVGLRLCASRLEELRHPLLANLAAALPIIGNGLAAVVSYGEAHVFMLQLQSTAAAAHARAAAASQALSYAAADEVRALTSGSTAAKAVTSLTSDYRRLCGLAASCISSAASWLGRHMQTLHTLSSSGMGSSSGAGNPGSGLQLLLAADSSEWDPALADRPLLLLEGNAAAVGAPDSSISSTVRDAGGLGLLVQALRSFLPGAAIGVAGAMDAGSSSSAMEELTALLPADLLQRCQQLDEQGLQLLCQQQELVAQGRWSLARYAALLEQLLSGGDIYIRTSYHWSWSTAFQAAAAGPELPNITTATATAPQMPTGEQVAATWACLAACWGVSRLVQEQHENAVGAAGALVEVRQGGQEAAALQLSSALQQLTGKMHRSGAEVDAAAVQYVASKALAEVCRTAEAAAAMLAGTPATGQSLHTSSAPASPPAPAVTGLASVVPHNQQALQLQLAALQAAMTEYEQSGLAYVLDPSTSTVSDELPEAAVDLEELVEAGDEEHAAAVMSAQQQSPQQHQWQQQVLSASTHLQLLSQLLVAIQYEALAPIAAWHAAAAASEPAAATGAGSPLAGSGSSRSNLLAAPTLQPAQQQQQQHVLLPAGPVSQQQLWSAAASHIQQHWLQLQQLLSQAAELETHMHTLAAVAAAGGATAIWPDDVDLMSAAIQLQQLLLPQGFDLLTIEECVTSAQLLQSQWAELEQLMWVALAECLCPLLNLSGPSQANHSLASAATAAAGQGAGAELGVLRQLLEAAAAGTAGGSLMHCRDVLEALAVGAAATGSSSSSVGTTNTDSVWGVPGLSDAWRCLVVLLLQYGCLQQQLVQQRRLQGGEAAASATDGDPSGSVDVLRSSKALPLDIEAQRPLFIAVQALHELLCNQGQETAITPTAAAAAAGGGVGGAVLSSGISAGQQVSLQQRLQDVLLPPLLAQLSPVLQQHLRSLQQHLDALASEAAAVLVRMQQQQGSSRDAMQHQARAAGGEPYAREQQAAAGDATSSSGGPELVPFDGFDMSLAGADMVLEELGLDEDSDGENELQQQQQHQQRSSEDAGSGAQGAAAVLPELVPFDAFDEGLEGAGMLLEDGGSAGDVDGADDEAMGGGFFGDLGAAGNSDDLLGGALEGDQEGAAQHQGQGSSAQAGLLEHGTPLADAADEARMLAQQLQAVGLMAATAALQQQTLAGLQQVQGSCAWQQQAWLRHLAAFEWLWGDVLQHMQQQELSASAGGSAATAAGSPLQQQLQQLLQASVVSVRLGGVAGADTPVNSILVEPGAAYQLYCSSLLPQLPVDPHHQSSSTHDASEPSQQQQQQQQLMPTRTELLQSWQSLCEQHAAVADALQAWRAAAAAACAAVCDVLLGSVEGGPPLLQVTDPTVCRKMLSGHVARAGHWLTGAAALCSNLSQQAEASLQLEYSRRGRLWAPGMPDGVDAFQGNTSLLQQLTSTATALADSQAQVSAAEALLASSQAAAAQAQFTIEQAAADAAAAEQQLSLKVPAALARAQGMLPVLEPMVAAAETALPFVTDGLGTTLRALVTLVERNSAARDLAPLVKAVCLQHGRCLRVLQRLHDIGAACAGGLMSTMRGMQDWLQQQGLPEQQDIAALLASTDPVRDAHLLQLLLTTLQPALAGVKEELAELGQAHVLFTHLTEQVDSLAGAAETVAAAITSDHAMQMPAAGHGRFMPAGSSSTGRKQRAEARQRAFAAAALARCTARLTGHRPAKTASQAIEAGNPDGTAVQRQPQSGAGRSRSVVDEVAALVAAATSVDKLSRMYEGWAAWL